MYKRDMPYMKNKIILITGPKHSGKSLATRALGQFTGYITLDLDELIEKFNGKSPRELYKEGPEIFRKAEARALAFMIGQGMRAEQLNSGTEYIIAATGGGLADNSEALALLSSHKEIIIVYLEVSSDTAWQRIMENSRNPPPGPRTEGSLGEVPPRNGELPAFLNTENPRGTQLALHEHRAKVYKKMAHLVITAEKKSPEEIAMEIIKRLEL